MIDRPYVLEFAEVTLKDLASVLGKPIGICGQAPSDYPEFATWLVSEQIDSISLNADVAIASTLRVARAEAALAGAPR
jgi:pyruvate,water dikinase